MATFEPGILNVLIGLSGSGKTSLLNSIAHRLRDNLTTKYRSSGRILFNEAIPAESVI
jgi:ABC-type multidrug transport system ATPase subunit